MLDKDFKIKNFIGSFDNFVKPETCDALINVFEKEKQIKNTWSRKDSEDAPKIMKDDEQFFITRDHMGGTGEDSISEIFSNLRETLNIYIKQTDILTYTGVKELHLSVNKIQKTMPTQGYHVWHVEKDYPRSCSRVLVYTIYLNDVVLGGETEFLFQQKRVSAKKGRICIFPAHFPYVHRGNPPLDGVKYIMTSWLHADQESYYG